MEITKRNLLKAQKELSRKGCPTLLTNGTLYIEHNNLTLELAEGEILFQAKLHDEKIMEDHISEQDWYKEMHNNE